MELTRFAYLPDVTLGWLTVGGLRLATLERPWLPNPMGAGGLQRQSCVPDGAYQVTPYTSARFSDVYKLQAPGLGVYPDTLPPGQDWGRVAILMHAGNAVEDVIGCVAVGLSHFVSGGQHQILRSQMALAQLRLAIGKAATTLTIQPTRGTAQES